MSLDKMITSHVVDNTISAYFVFGKLAYVKRVYAVFILSTSCFEKFGACRTLNETCMLKTYHNMHDTNSLIHVEIQKKINPIYSL